MGPPLLRAWSALAIALTLLVACTGGGGAERSASMPSPEPWHGGTLRVVVQDLFVSQLDPSNYVGFHAWELHRCCLSRTLVSYEGFPTAEGGTVPRPDLAAGMPTVSEDGLTWTFHLKPGLRYAPPFEGTEIVAGDVVRALERPVEPWARTGYGFYYSIIDGYDEFLAGEADSISGLETPDPYTLVVRLEEPAGDLPHRFAMAATAPIPEGAADGHLRDYIRYLAASGPYMIEGSRQLDPSLPPERQEPVAGLVPDGSLIGTLTLVRNPSWDPASDDVRVAYADRIEVAFAPQEQLGDRGSIVRAERRIDAGAVDVDTFSFYAPHLDRFPQSQIRLAEQASVAVIPMNLAMPPFDDVHVRKAVGLVIDRERVARTFGGSFVPVELAWHLAPGAAVGGLLEEWRPSWLSQPAGDLAAARTEMRLSAYDRDGDGRCDAKACEAVRALAQRFEPEGEPAYRWRPIRDALRSIGVELEISEMSFDACQARAFDPEARWGIWIGFCTGWMLDYPNGSTWFQPLLHGEMAGAGYNLSLLGASAGDLEAWGYEVTEVPSVDARIDRCLGITGTAQTECWAELDQYLSEEIVPWVPLTRTTYPVVVSERVAAYSWAESSGMPAFDRISLVRGSE